MFHLFKYLNFLLKYSNTQILNKKSIYPLLIIINPYLPNCLRLDQNALVCFLAFSA